MRKTVGVLGSTGFLGGFVCDKFRSAGWDVIGGSRRIGVDATSCQSILDWIINNKIKYIVNLAAFCGGIGLNVRQPADLWLETTKIISATLEAARLANVEKFVQIGTICSYAYNSPTPFVEDDLMKHGFPEESNAAYGVAKLNGLFGCQAYRKQYGLDAVFLLPVNLYGPRDNFDLNSSHVIPALIRKCHTAHIMKTDYVEIWGDGTPTREFLYVDDCAQAILMATEQYSKPDPINIGTGIETSIVALAETIKQEIGYSGRFKFDITKPNGQMRRRLDIYKAKVEFGFIAQTKLCDGIRHTIQWYLSSKYNSL